MTSYLSTGDTGLEAVSTDHTSRYLVAHAVFTGKVHSDYRAPSLSVSLLTNGDTCDPRARDHMERRHVQALTVHVQSTQQPAQLASSSQPPW